MKDLHIRDGRYRLGYNPGEVFTFTTDKGELSLTVEDAMEVATALFDWAGMPYEPLYKIDEKIEEGEL